jgi:hypothetical protein
MANNEQRVPEVPEVKWQLRSPLPGAATHPAGTNLGKNVVLAFHKLFLLWVKQILEWPMPLELASGSEGIIAASRQASAGSHPSQY